MVTALPDLSADIAGRSLSVQDVLVSVSCVWMAKSARVPALLVAFLAIACAVGFWGAVTNGAAMNLVIRDARPLLAFIFGIQFVVFIRFESDWALLASGLRLSLVVSAGLSVAQALTGVSIIGSRVEGLSDDVSVFRVLTEAETLAVIVVMLALARLWLSLGPAGIVRSFIERITSLVPLSCAVVLIALEFGRSLIVDLALFAVFCGVLGLRFYSMQALSQGAVRLGKSFGVFAILASVLHFVPIARVNEVASSFASSFSDRVIDGLVGGSTQVEDSNTSRVLENAAALSSVAMHPILGTGFGLPYRHYFMFEVHDPDTLAYIHDVPLLVLVRLGLVGLLLLLAPLVWVATRALIFGTTVWEFLAGAALLALFLSSFASPSLVAYGGAPVVGMLVGVCVVGRKERAQLAVA